MSPEWAYYVATLVVFLGVNAIACWSFDLQLGTTGILNFGFILFQAAGAYTAAVLTLGPPSTSFESQSYVFGASLPWPLPWIAAMVVGGLLALIVGVVAMHPVRRDYQAIAMLVIAISVFVVVSSEPKILNGTTGLGGIPQLFSGLRLDFADYGWFYAGLTCAVAAGVYFVIHRIKGSPWGRRLRAIRENRAAAAALGTNVRKETLAVFVIGGVFAALSGAVLVQFITAWAPNSWEYAETFVYLTAIVVGGMGNSLGVILGTVLVQTVIVEGVTFLPSFSTGTIVASLQWLIISALLIAFLWWRPRGLVPERRRTFPGGQAASPEAGVLPAVSMTGHPAGGPNGSARGSKTNALEVHGLVCAFGGVRAVDGADFVVPSGRVTCLVGPNGAGKSTVLNAIAGVLSPVSGSIRLHGKEISGLPPYKVAKRRVIRTFQLPSVFGHLTVLENLIVGAPSQLGDSFWGALRGKGYWRRSEARLVERAREMLSSFGMAAIENQYADELSGGQKRMVEIMRALMAKPDVLLLDEPLAGVNPTLARRVEESLTAIRGQGITILMVEHELEAVERLSDSVVMMASGRVMARGSMKELRANTEVIDAYIGR